MSKQTIPLVAQDISAFARALSKQLRSAKDTPGHLGLLNMLARASGFRNYQHLRSAHGAAQRIAKEQVAETLDHKRVERTLNQFDDAGRLMRWPSRQSVQDLSLWALWARLPAEVAFSEVAFNEQLDGLHLFGDPAILRRSLVAQGHFTRNIDGSDYRRVERPPPAEARALIAQLKHRRMA